MYSFHFLHTYDKISLTLLRFKFKQYRLPRGDGQPRSTPATAQSGRQPSGSAGFNRAPGLLARRGNVSGYPGDGRHLISPREAELEALAVLNHAGYRGQGTIGQDGGGGAGYRCTHPQGGTPLTPTELLSKAQFHLGAAIQRLERIDPSTLTPAQTATRTMLLSGLGGTALNTDTRTTATPAVNLAVTVSWLKRIHQKWYLPWVPKPVLLIKSRCALVMAKFKISGSCVGCKGAGLER